MKRFLKDNETGEQVIEGTILNELFPKLQATPNIDLIKLNKWKVLLAGGLPNALSWQIVVQNIKTIENVFYHVFIFNSDEDMLSYVPVKSTQIFPCLAEKDKGLDYFDWLELQGALFKWLAENKYKVFNIDFDPKGKVVYILNEGPNITLEKLKQGEPYTVNVVDAEAFVEQLKKAKAEEKRIIV